MKKRDDLKILLMQIRDDKPVIVEERTSFARHSGLSIDQISLLNVFNTPAFPVTIIDRFDALYIGGSSNVNVLETTQLPFLKDATALIHHCIETSKPVFASCFGHQLVVTALGGEIISDTDEYEMGTIPISLTEKAAEDLLYRDMSNGFLAVSVHQERALEAPPGCDLLAYTDMCIHGLKVVDKPIWTTQFHPEVDRAVMVERITRYAKKYTSGADQLLAVANTAQETPESNGMLKNFVNRVLLAD